MSHVQQQIIDALDAALAGSHIVGTGHVYKERVDPFPAGITRALGFEESAGDGEKTEQLDLDGVEERAYAIDISCAVKHAEGYGGQARELGLQVELLLASEQAAMQPLIDLCAGGIRLARSRMIYSGDGDEAVAVRLHTWLFIYRVHQARPDVALT